MDLSDTHKVALSRFFNFFKGKRERSLANAQANLGDFKSDRLCDEGALFNKADVENLMDQFFFQASSEFREELERECNLAAVYISQLLMQADQSGLAMTADIMCVEDQGRIAEVVAVASGATATPAAPLVRLGTLPSMGATAGGSIGNAQEIQTLKEENELLSQRFQQMQSQTLELLKDRSSLSHELDQVKASFSQLATQLQGAALDPATSNQMMDMERCLGDSSARLDAKRAECEQMRNELEKRSGDTTQFKAILKKKSDEVKELRRRLQEAGLPWQVDDGQGIDLAPDDD